MDRVSRTNVPGIYAAGDCTGLLALASVAAMQGRIAMWHALGEAVAPLRLQDRLGQRLHRPGAGHGRRLTGRCGLRPGAGPGRSCCRWPATPRAKMADVQDGFVKLFCRPASGLVIGGVVVAPKASELILPIAMAVENHLSVDQLAHTITIYPSLSGLDRRGGPPAHAARVRLTPSPPPPPPPSPPRPAPPPPSPRPSACPPCADHDLAVMIGAILRRSHHDHGDLDGTRSSECAATTA